MTTPTRSFTLLFLLLLMTILGSSLRSQAVDGFFDELKKRWTEKDFLRVNGSVQTSLRWNYITGITARRQPFSGQLTTGLLLDILGAKGSFSAAFSDGNLNYNLPAYAFYGYSPSYKWVQLHLGDRSLELSPYSLSGQNFKGIGLELRPGKFHFATFVGRLRAARLADAGTIQNIDPVYRRVGKGIKVGFDDGKNAISGVIFHALDDATSLVLNDSLPVRPQANLVLDMQGKKTLGERFDVTFNLAHSAFTRDQTAPDVGGLGAGLNGTVFGLYQPNSSTRYGSAWNLAVNFTPTFASFSLSAERLGAGYQSLGRLAFLNDTENVQLGMNTILFKKRVTLAASVGIQRNGITDKSAIASNRAIGSFNFGLSLSERVNLSASLSNINYTLRQRVSTVPVLVVDSIVLVQNNVSGQLASSFLFGAEKRSTFLAALAYQRAGTVATLQMENEILSDFYSGILTYTWSESDNGWQVSLNTVTSYTNLGIVQITIISPSVNVQKTVLDERLALDVGLAHSFVLNSLGSRSRVWEFRVGGNFKINDKHRLQSQFSYINNSTVDETIQLMLFQDINARLAYQFNF